MFEGFRAVTALILTVSLSLIAIPRVQAGAWAQLQSSLGAWDGVKVGGGHAVAMADEPAVPTPGNTAVVGDLSPDTVRGTFDTPDGLLMWQQRDAALASDQVREKLKGGEGNNDIGAALNGVEGGWLVARDMETNNTPYYIFYDSAQKKVLYISVAKINMGGKEASSSGIEARNGGPLVTYTGEGGSTVKVRMVPNSQVMGYTLAFNGDKFQDGEILSASMLVEVLGDRTVVPEAVAAKLNANPVERTARGEADLIKNDKPWAESITAWLSGPTRTVVVTSSAPGRFLLKLRENKVDKHYIYATAANIKDYPVR